MSYQLGIMYCNNCANPAANPEIIYPKGMIVMMNETEHLENLYGGMGSGPIPFGGWIIHSGKQKFWCKNCVMPEDVPPPRCGAVGCRTCKPGALHFCDYCEKHGATHRSRWCPKRLFDLTGHKSNSIPS
jgi:hypothetical protein